MVSWAVLAFLKPNLKAQNPQISGRSSRNAHFSSKNGPREMVKWSPSNRGVNITHQKKAATISPLLCLRRGQTGRVRKGGFGGHLGFDKGLFGIFFFLAVFFPLLNTAATLTGVRPTISSSFLSGCLVPFSRNHQLMNTSEMLVHTPQQWTSLPSESGGVQRVVTWHGHGNKFNTLKRRTLQDINARIQDYVRYGAAGHVKT